MLCLFDIDGTLIDTRGAGMASLRAACRDVFGDDGPPLDLAGATDLGLLEKFRIHYGIDPADTGLESRFFETYHHHLEAHLHAKEYPGSLIDGATDLIDALAASGRAALGLLTGNTARGAHLKVRRHGIDHHFPFGAYGCDHADRNRLGPIAVERAARHHGRGFEPNATWIIGDTPRDITCAKAIGARCLAVATGSFTADELAAHQPDIVCESLTAAVAHLVP
jgi:phosphoglycolate phosphatase-like HAD superfamily hydrolase